MTLLENKILYMPYFLQIVLLFFALVAIASDGIFQLLVIVLGTIFIIFAVVTNVLLILYNEKYTWLFSILNIIQISIFIFATRPLFQEVALFFYVNPWVLEALFISLIFGIITYVITKVRNTPARYGDEYKSIGYGFIIFFVLFIILITTFALLSAYPKCYLAKTLDINEIDTLPEMDAEFLRITPMKVSDRYVTDACQYPMHTPSKPCDITMIDNRPHWAYLLVPDGFVNAYNIKPKGAAFVDMTTTDKKLEIKEQTIQISPDLSLTDDIYWKIHEINYWADCERTLVILYEDEIYLAVPYIEYDLHFDFPMFYRSPKWGGVFIVDKDGNIEDVDSKKAQNHPVLQGQKIFPEKLVLEYIDSQRFWKSKTKGFIDAITNTWFSHSEEIEITDVSNQGNSQPFLINTKEGLKWFVSVEPHGAAHGIYRIYLVDARTGNIEMKKYNTDEIGPVKACNYAKTDNPMVDWSQFQVIEPIPVTPDGELYWEVRIVPKDGSGISYTSFVDPKTGKVTECKTDEQIYQFIEGKLITNETTDNVTGKILDIDVFVKNGNTHWIIELNEIDYFAQAENLELDILTILVDLKINDNVTIYFDSENVIKNLIII